MLPDTDSTERGNQLSGEIPSAWDLCAPSLRMYNIKGPHILRLGKAHLFFNISLPGPWLFYQEVFSGRICQVLLDLLNFFVTLALFFSSALGNVTSPAVLSTTLFSLNPTEYQRLHPKVAQSYLLSITGWKVLLALALTPHCLNLWFRLFPDSIRSCVGCEL